MVNKKYRKKYYSPFITGIVVEVQQVFAASGGDIPIEDYIGDGTDIGAKGNHWNDSYWTTEDNDEDENLSE